MPGFLIEHIKSYIDIKKEEKEIHKEGLGWKLQDARVQVVGVRSKIYPCKVFLLILLTAAEGPCTDGLWSLLLQIMH